MTYWFNRKPGQFVVSTADQDQCCSDPRLEEHVLLIGADAPDWIRVPSETPHPDAGKGLRVTDIFAASCPRCASNESPVRTYALEKSELLVAECDRGHGFVWYTMRQ